MRTNTVIRLTDKTSSRTKTFKKPEGQSMTTETYDKGLEIRRAVLGAEYVDKAIASAPSYGKGFGPLNHLVSFNLKNNNV